MKLTYAQIIAQHQTLQKTEAAPVAPERVEQVKAFIADVVAAGADIADQRQREQLRSILRYWSAWVYDQTKEFPPSQLVPFSGTGPARPAISPSIWFIGILALIAILLSVNFLLIQPQTAALRMTEAVAVTQHALAVLTMTAANPATELPTSAPTPTPVTPTVPPTSSPTWTLTPSVTPTRTPGPSPTPTATQPPRALITLHQEEGLVFGVAFSPDGKLLAAGGGNGVLTLWDISTTGEPIVVATITPGASILNLGFSPDGTYLAITLLDGTAQVWQTGSQPKRIKVLEGHRDSVTDVAFSVDGTLLATVSTDATAKLWNVGPWNEFTPPLPSANPLISVAFSPVGNLLAYGGTGSRILLWDFAQDRVVTTLNGPGKAGRNLAFSPDGLVLASGSYDGSVRLWKRNSTETFEFAAPRVLEEKNSGYDVAFSPTGVLATAHEDGAIDIWDIVVEPPKLVATLTGQHSGPVRSLAFSPDGSMLASGGSDQTVVLWVVR